MRIAALYDVHGNLPALEAVLREVREAGVDRVVVGGDVFPGPMDRESLLRLLELTVPVDFLRGNGESAVLASRAGRSLGRLPDEARRAVTRAADRLEPDLVDVIAGWPASLRVKVPGEAAVLFCHATPASDTDVFTRETPEEALRPLFEGLDVSLVVCGHTHMPFDRTVGGRRVVNAGSVGMPYGAPGASWLLLGPEVEPRHTRYDLAAAARRIRNTGTPGADAFAERCVLDPPSEAEMLEVLSRAEIELDPAEGPG